MNEFRYGVEWLTAGITLDIARGKTKGILSKEAVKNIEKSYNDVQEIVQTEKTVYGINTGFGPLCSKSISKEDTEKLQYNILRSHSSGVGDDIPIEVAKLMLILKVQALSKGYSGINLSTLNRIIWHIENDIIPAVPCQGSVGASGDLAPLSHLFLPLIGFGKVYMDGKLIETSKIFKKYKLKPLKLGAKEGLALINGTQFMAAFSVRAIERFKNCLETADILGAMSLESLLGSIAPFKEELHDLRPYPGTKYVAFRLRTLLEDSQMVKSHINCERVQDPYSLRCMPQVHGASRNAWKHFKETIEIELNSVTDNPIILSSDETISGGNFHGEPIAIPIDYATVAVSELGNISDRRIYLLLEGLQGLPILLMDDTGINSGFMIPQYTSAALASENKTLCFPASADSIPTSLGQEDHVSMGSIGCRKLNQVIDNVENILAVELLCAAQAFDFRKPLKSSTILEACHNIVRSKINHADEDRVFADDLITARKLIQDKTLAKEAIRCAKNKKIEFKGDGYESFRIY
ncbi:MAG: histidine ammonia-lyase [Spirochaetaceae bacterium]